MYKVNGQIGNYKNDEDVRCDEIQERKCISNELDKAISRLLEVHDMATKSITVLRGPLNAPCNENVKCGEPSIVESIRRINEIALELGDKLSEIMNLL